MSELLKRLEMERMQGNFALNNYPNDEYWVNWDELVNVFEEYAQPQLNENQQSIEDYVEMAIVQLREANLILNKVYEKDRFAREIQDDISEIMGTLRYRYFGGQGEE